MNDATNNTHRAADKNNSGFPTIVDEAAGPDLKTRDGAIIADSRDVALRFGREHKLVLRAIRDLIAKAPELGRCNFVPFKNKDLTGETTSHYEMDRDGFTLLAMGFTGEAALRWKMLYIAAFKALELETTRAAKMMSPAEILIAQGQAMLAVERRQAALAAKQEEQGVQIAETQRRLNQIETATDYFTVVGYARWTKKMNIDLKTAAEVGRHATRRANHLGVKVGKIPDPRFGAVSQYPKAILDFVWDEVFATVQ